MSDGNDLFGPPIHVYSRAQALEDGALVDVSAFARDFGIRHPCALTRAVWLDCCDWEEADNRRKGTAQNATGRICDVLAMAAWRLRAGRDDARGEFSVLRTPREGQARRPQRVDLVIHCGPGDTPEPVLTIMLPGED